jgi:hypothetical protein
MEYLIVVGAFVLILGVCEGVREVIEKHRPDWTSENRGARRW